MFIDFRRYYFVSENIADISGEDCFKLSYLENSKIYSNLFLSYVIRIKTEIFCN